MFEYVLGIGNLTKEQCNQVLGDVSKRAKSMRDAIAILQNEYNHLEMIKFQVTQRLTELTKDDIK